MTDRLKEIQGHLDMYLGLDRRDFAAYAYSDLEYLLGRVRTLEAVNTSALGNLRHLYGNLVSGAVWDEAGAQEIARGLLGPTIERMERAALASAEP